MKQKLLAPIAALAMATSAQAAVIELPDFAVQNSSNPNSANIIDYLAWANNVGIDATGSTAQTTLEARSDILVISDFRQSPGQADNTPGGSGGSMVPQGGSTNQNTYYWTNSLLNRPAVQIDPGSNWRSNSGAPSAGGSGTARYEGLNIINNTLDVDVSFTIDFGVYNSGTGIFNGAAGHVYAAGFTMTALSDGQTVSALFYSAAGSLISTQTAAGTSTENTAYFGFVDETNYISRIYITRSSAGIDTTVIGDIAFTAIVPEPSGTILLLGGLGALFLLRRRSLSCSKG